MDELINKNNNIGFLGRPTNPKNASNHQSQKRSRRLFANQVFCEKHQLSDLFGEQNATFHWETYHVKPNRRCLSTVSSNLRANDTKKQPLE